MAILTDVMAARTYAKGVQESARQGIQIPAGANYMVIRVARDATPWDVLTGAGGGKLDKSGGVQDPFSKILYPVGGGENEVIRLFLVLSVDGGNTWAHGGYMGAIGAHHVFRDGRIATESRLSVWLPEWDNPNRVARLILDVRKDVRTKVDVEVLSLPAVPFVLKDDHHSVAVNASATGAQATAATSVGTGSITPGGSNRLVFMTGGNSSGSPGGQTVTFNWNGGAITAEAWDIQAQTYWGCAGGYLLNPAASSASGTQFTSSGSDECAAGAIACDGVDQTTPIAGSNSANGSSGASSVNTSASAAAGDCVVDGVYQYDTAVTAAQGQTSRYSQTNIGGSTSMACGTKTGTGTITMGYNAPANGTWLIGTTIIKSAAGAPTVSDILRAGNKKALLHF